MPQLKQLSCCVQWADTNAPFPEYDLTYGDGVVESVIIVPSHPQAFCIRLTSHGFICEGLSMVVYIDGKYQCNRSRVNLKLPAKDQTSKSAEIDFLVRQQETSFGDGAYIGREWRFDNHNIINRTVSDAEIDHFSELGTIEVIVLRCKAAATPEADHDGSSSGADTHISDLGEERRVVNNTTGTKDAEPVKAAEAEVEDASLFGGLGLGLFDGPSDLPPYDGTPGAQGGRYIWQQTTPPSTQDFNNIYNIGQAQQSHPHLGPGHHHRQSASQNGYPHTGPPHHAQQAFPQYAAQHPSVSQHAFSHAQPHQQLHQAFPQYGSHPGHHPSFSQSIPHHTQPPPHQAGPSLPKHVHFEPPHIPSQPHFPQHTVQPGYMQPPPQSAPPPITSQTQMPGSYPVQYSQSNPYPPQQFYNQPNNDQSRPSTSSFRRHAQDFTSQAVNESNWSSNNQNQTQNNNNGRYSNKAAQSSQNSSNTGSWQNNAHQQQQSNGNQNQNQNQSQGTNNGWNTVSNGNQQNQNSNQNGSNWNNQDNNNQQRRSSQQSKKNQSSQGQNNSPQTRNMSNANNLQQPSTLPAMQQSMPEQSYIYPGQYPYIQPYPGQWYHYPQYMNMMPQWPMTSYGMFPGQEAGVNNGKASFDSAISPKTGCAGCDAPAENGQENGGDQADTANGWANSTTSDANNTNDTSWENNGNTNDTQRDGWPDTNDNNQNDFTNNDFNSRENGNANNDTSWDDTAKNDTNGDGWNENDTKNDAQEDWNKIGGSGAANESWANDTSNANVTGKNNATTNVEDGQDFARNLYGPNGVYVRMSQPADGEPAPVEPEEPAKYDVPQAVAEDLWGSTKQVQPGPGYRYYKRRLVPDYIDTLQEPYARFVFLYRTKAQADKSNMNIDVEPSSNQEVNELQTMEKQQLIDMLIRAKGKLGGKIPSPPATPTPETKMPGAFPVKAPKLDHLKYSIPQKSEPASRNVSGADNNSRKSSASIKPGEASWDNTTNQTQIAGWDANSNQKQNQTDQWRATPTWDGQGDDKGKKRASVSSAKTVKPADAEGGHFDLSQDTEPPFPPTPVTTENWEEKKESPAVPKSGW